MPLLEVHDLRVHFPIGNRLRSGRPFITAVDGVSFDVSAGEVVALVGESGCGKSTIARAIVGLERPTEGEIKVNGRTIDQRTVTRERRRDVQLIFQDPSGSLNPRKTVGQTLATPLRVHRVVARTQVRDEVKRLLELVGLRPAETFLSRYPHELSGGQRQRVAIGRALSVRPSLIIADEPVSALDISVRAQILRLMRELQGQLGVGYLFISHDLGVVRSLADRVLVMYLGQVVESGTAATLFERPMHPYTAALLAASPILDPKLAKTQERTILHGTVPSAIDPPQGCRFRARCPLSQDRCELAPPIMEPMPGHRARCHFAARVRMTGRVVKLSPEPHDDTNSTAQKAVR